MSDFDPDFARPQKLKSLNFFCLIDCQTGPIKNIFYRLPTAKYVQRELWAKTSLSKMKK